MSSTEVAAADAAGSAKAPPGRPLGQTISLVTLAVLAVFYTLSVAQDIVLPFLLAVVLNLLLQPAMRLLRERLRIPGSLSALLLIILLFGVVVAVGAAISVPAAGWFAKIPESLPKLLDRLSALGDPVKFVRHAMDQLEHLLQQAPAPGSGGPAPAQPPAQGSAGGSPIAGLSMPSASNLGGFGLNLLLGTQHLFGRLFTLVILLFFLLASGSSLLRNLVEVVPTLADKRRVVLIAQEIESNVSGYLVTITFMNLGVGLLNGLATYFCGLPDALLWGTLAFLLNYIPILGPLTGMVIFFFVGLFSFDVLWYAVIPPGIYLLIHVLEGETITPMLLARRFTLNPVLIIVSLFFWDWMWGVPGALLSVPMLAIFKIVCDHVPSLAPLGHMLGAPKHRTRPGQRSPV